LDTGSIEIKPITILIGENSTGKTSFLAALRILLEWTKSAETNPFNRSPYFLGGFDQISHANTAQKHKNNSFVLSISDSLYPSAIERVRVDNNQGKLFEGTAATRTRVEEPFTHTLSFGKGFSQPDLMKYDFSIGTQEASFDFRDDWVKWRIVDKDKELDVSDENFKDRVASSDRDPSSFFRQNGRFLTYLISSVRRQFRSQRDIKKEELFFSNDYLLDFSGKFDRASSLMARKVFASAPVRSEPKRTYNPSEFVTESEGANVLLELAGAKTRNDEDWRKIREALSKFGKSAGLFEDIDVRQLGKKDGDPFQIQVKAGGPKVNLVDVGYGVSQALPIIYQIQNHSRYDTFLLQQPEVHLHPRAQAELGSLIGDLVSTKKNKPYFIVETHSDYITNRICIEIINKKLNPKDVKILYFSRVGRHVEISSIDVDQRGQLTGAPPDFKSFFLEEQRRFLGL
jgi:predicted ATPase